MIFFIDIIYQVIKKTKSAKLYKLSLKLEIFKLSRRLQISLLGDWSAITYFLTYWRVSTNIVTCNKVNTFETVFVRTIYLLWLLLVFIFFYFYMKNFTNKVKVYLISESERYTQSTYLLVCCGY